MAKIVLFVFMIAICQAALGQMNISGTKPLNSKTASSLKAGLAGFESGIKGLEQGLDGIRSGFGGLMTGVTGLSSGPKSGLNGIATGLVGTNSAGFSSNYKSRPSVAFSGNYSPSAGGTDFKGKTFNSGHNSRLEEVNFSLNGIKSGANGVPTRLGVGNSAMAANGIGNTNIGLNPSRKGIPMAVYSISPISPSGVKAAIEASCDCAKKRVDILNNGNKIPKNNMWH